MAKIVPFKGILYNPNKIHDLSDVAAPPYDVISEQDQCYFYDCHSQNVIRLILGKIAENDRPGNNCHTRAAECFQQWRSEKILVQDHSPAFYLTSVQFPFEDRTITRFGLIASVRLEPFEKGIILPHEKTFSKVKSERLELMKVCHTNFSPIFSLYSDRNGVLDFLKNSVVDKVPDNIFTEKRNRHQHKMWRITAPEIHRYVSESMRESRIFIADGHHRYETALNYRDWLAAKTPDFSENHPANYVMMYLSSMEDPGVVILPAHRMLKGVSDSLLAEFIQKAEAYFDIVRIPYSQKEGSRGKNEFLAKLKSDTDRTVFGVSLKNTRELYLLTLKPGVMKEMFGNEIPDALRNLDVTVLTRLIFMEMLGFDQAGLDNEKLIAYSSIAEEAVDAPGAGKCDISFILNPTKIEQVRDIALKGLIMPRKSTYFYPKVITGQVMNGLKAED